MECIKWSGSERVSQECLEDILIKVIDIIDIGSRILRERGERSDQLYSFPTGFGLRPLDH